MAHRKVRLVFTGLVVVVGLAWTWSASAVAQTGSSPAAHWPMYGHDSAHRGSSPANGPNSPDLLWVYPDEIVGGVSVGPDGTIYGSSYNPDILRAINPGGTLKWEWTAGFGERIRGVPAIGDGALYTVVAETLLAFDTADGDVLWTYPINIVSSSNPTIGPDGTIYIATQLGDYVPGTGFEGGYLYAINPNGTLRWRFESGVDNCGFETTAAVGPNGDIYIQHNCRGLMALSSSGQALWETGGGIVGNPFNSPSVGPDGTIYIGSSDYSFRAFNPDGTLKWAAPVQNWMYGTSSAISADGATIFRGDNGGVFYAFDSAGSLRWSFDSGWGVFDPPAIAANGIVYFTQDLDSSAEPGDLAYLYALRASDGALLWRYPLGQGGGAPAIGPDGTLYVTIENPTFTVRLYAFRCADGVCAPTAQPTPTPTRTATPPPGQTCTAYTSADVPRAIPDLGTVTSGLNVPEAFTLVDVDVVGLSITHPYDSDLDVSLLAPSGASVELFTDVGGDGDDFSGTALDDAAAQSITAGAAPFAGTYRPEGELSALNGQNASGAWTLQITDDTGFDVGTLNAWGLRLCRGTPATASPTPSATAAATLPPGGWYDVYLPLIRKQP